MDYETFLNYIRENIAEYLERDGQHDKVSYEVDLHKEVKNNGIVLDGITLRKKGEHISPNIYLNRYYENYRMGRPLSSIMEEIVCLYRKEGMEHGLKVDDITDFEAVRDKIVLRLVNYEKNREQLMNCPYKRFLDMAVTFRYLAGKDPKGIASSMITNEEYRCWDTGMEELYETALFNTMREFPWHMDSLAKVLADYIKLRMPDMVPEELMEDMGIMDKRKDSLAMYVLTNDTGINGAACILYDNVIRNFAGVQEANLFLLPSSVHEMMLVPEDTDTDPQLLQEMVREANETAVGLIDLLSDNIYYYDREKDRITIYEQTVTV